MFLRNILIVAISFLCFNNVANSQIPTTDIVVVLEEAFGLSLEGTELYQNFNDIKTQIAQIEQGLEGNAELQRAAEIVRQYNDILQESKMNDFSGMLNLVANFDQFGQGNGMSDFLSLNISEFDADGLYQTLSTSNFSDMSYQESITSYQDLNTFVEGVSQNTRKMQLQTALTYFQLSEQYKEKAIELDMLLNGTTNRSFTASGGDLGFSTVTGIFESIKGLLPGADLMGNLAEGGFGIKNLFTLGSKIKNGITNLFSSDPEWEDFSEEQQAEILAEYEEFDIDGNGELDSEEYAEIVEYITDALEEDMKERTENAANIFSNLTEGVSGLSSAIGDFTIAGEEATLVATDAERISMMQQRDEYISKSIEYQEKGAELMSRATELSPKEKESRNANVVKNVSEGLASTGKVGGAFSWGDWGFNSGSGD